MLCKEKLRYIQHIYFAKMRIFRVDLCLCLQCMGIICYSVLSCLVPPKLNFNIVTCGMCFRFWSNIVGWLHFLLVWWVDAWRGVRIDDFCQRCSRTRPNPATLSVPAQYWSRVLPDDNCGTGPRQTSTAIAAKYAGKYQGPTNGGVTLWRARSEGSATN